MDHLTFAQLLGNYGEFIGAIAVVITLGYLAVQIRQNTAQLRENEMSLRRAEAHSTFAQHDRYRLATLDPEIAQLWVRGLDGQLTERADRLRFNNLMVMMTYSCQNNWELGQLGLGKGWTSIAESVASTYETPGGKRWWERSRGMFAPGYVESVEKHLQRVES